MTEPRKSDHWNSLLDEIGVPASEARPAPTSAEPPSRPPAAATSSPRPRAKPEPRPQPAPAKKSSWTSLLGALGLAAPEATPASEPVAQEPPAPEPPPRAVEREEQPQSADREERSERDVRSERQARSEREERQSGHLLDEFRPRYKPEEPPFPQSRRRETVDDVAMDIDLDADFAFEDRPDMESDVDVEPAGEVIEPRPATRREDEEGDERGGRRRRRRRRGGRRQDEEREPTGQRERERREPLSRGEDLDLDAELPLGEADEEVVSRREEPEVREDEPEGEDRGRRQRRRRGRGSRDRDRDESRPTAEGRPSRRPERLERDAEQTSRVREDEEPIEIMDDLGDDEPAGEHAVHKKIPTWAETVGVLIDANIAARSSRQPDRGRPRRPRRGDR